MKVKDFFEAKVWKSLIDYEKIRLTNIYENYCQMEKLGLEPNPPDFVVAYNQRRLMNKKRKRNGRKPKSRRGDSPPSKKLKLGKKTKGTAKSIEQLDNDENAVVPSEASESTSTSTTTSGELSNGNGRKGLFALEIFNIGDNSTPVTRLKWKKRNDHGRSSVEKSGYAIRTAAREKKNYNYDSTMEEDDDIESRNEDKSASEERNEDKSASEERNEDKIASEDRNEDKSASEERNEDKSGSGDRNEYPEPEALES